MEYRKITMAKNHNKKRNIASYYLKNINNKKIQLFKISKNSCFHQFVILVNQRNKFLKYLAKFKIPYGFHYPYTIHSLPAIRKYCEDKKFKNSVKIAKKELVFQLILFYKKNN